MISEGIEYYKSWSEINSRDKKEYIIIVIRNDQVIFNSDSEMPK